MFSHNLLRYYFKRFHHLGHPLTHSISLQSSPTVTRHLCIISVVISRFQSTDMLSVVTEYWSKVTVRVLIHTWAQPLDHRLVQLLRKLENRQECTKYTCWNINIDLQSIKYPIMTTRARIFPSLGISISSYTTNATLINQSHASKWVLKIWSCHNWSFLRKISPNPLTWIFSALKLKVHKKS